MGKKKILSQKEIEEILRPIVEEIKLDIIEQTFLAIQRFYHDYSPRIYKRSKGMYGISAIRNIQEKPIKDGIMITFTFSADDIGKPEHHGNVGEVFEADFIHGFHGGPRRTEDGITWAYTPQMYPSPWDRIADYVENKY